MPTLQRLLTTGARDAKPAAEACIRRRRGRAKSRVLVLAPTRELAVQIEDEIHGLAYHTTVTSAAVYGGVEMGMQERALKAGVDIIVATPGRLMDHMRQQNADLSGDRAARPRRSRSHDGHGLLARRAAHHHARCPASARRCSSRRRCRTRWCRIALEIMREREVRPGGAAQRSRPRASRTAIEAVAANDKLDWLIEHLRRPEGPVLIFSRTKIGADRLARKLAAAGVKCTALHADRSQDQRRIAVEGFKGGKYKVLVATDIAARGLDIDGIHTVINYEVPDSPDAYVHRVGRTGRADEVGQAITLVAPEERRALAFLEKAVGRSIRMNADVRSVRTAPQSSDPGHDARAIGGSIRRLSPGSSRAAGGVRRKTARNAAAIATCCRWPARPASIPKRGAPTARSSSFAARRRSASPTTIATNSLLDAELLDAGCLVT